MHVTLYILPSSRKYVAVNFLTLSQANFQDYKRPHGQIILSESQVLLKGLYTLLYFILCINLCINAYMYTCICPNVYIDKLNTVKSTKSKKSVSAVILLVTLVIVLVVIK